MAARTNITHSVGRLVLAPVFTLVVALGTVSMACIGTPAWATTKPLPRFAAAIDAGGQHNCAVLHSGDVRCWGDNNNGQLGYGITDDRIGLDETPDSVGPVDLGGLKATAVSAGDYHTCVILEDHGVRCWGFNTSGQLGYGISDDIIGDTEVPNDFENVALGTNRTAKAITAGGAHTCAILDNGHVRCWGRGSSGQLGYGNENNIGDTEHPDATVGNVNLGGGRTAVAIAAGSVHTCAILDNGKVRCWGAGADGRLGYGNEDDIGDGEDPDFATVGNVNLGGGSTAIAIAAGGAHTCVILDNSQVRCWGHTGPLGYGTTDNIGDDENPTFLNVGDVDLSGADAIRITAGNDHTCTTLSTGGTRCWGSHASNLGLGLAGLGTIGDVDLATAGGPRPPSSGVTAGFLHTCAAFDDGGVLCWGSGDDGALGRGNGNAEEIGDNEAPGLRSNIQLGGPVLIPGSINNEQWECPFPNCPTLPGP